MNNQAAAQQLMQMNNQPTPSPQQMQMNNPVMPWQLMPMNDQAAVQQLMQMNDQAAAHQVMQMNNLPTPWPQMQMNNPLMPQQLMPMNNQAAAQQPMQMNGQAAEEQLPMQMNDQAAAQQMMPMNNQPTPSQLMEMYEEIMKEAEAEKIKHAADLIRERNADVPRYRPLYKAIRERNWKAVEDFVNNDPEALNDDITEFGENIFHLLSPFDEAIGLVEKFVSKVTQKSLERVNVRQSTALLTAIVSGNTKAVKILVDKNKNLLSLGQTTYDILAVHAAAYCSRKETVEYLLSETAKVVDLTDKNGALLLKILIKSHLFGTALYLLKQYPELACDDKNRHWRSTFNRMARQPLLFASGARLGFWQSFVYNCIPSQEERNPYLLPKREAADVEKPTDISKSSSAAEPFRFQQIRATFGELLHKLNIIFWNTLMQLAPSIKCIHDTKLMHTQTLEIVKMMIGDYSNWNYVKASKLLKESVFFAASSGIYEVVDEVLKACNFVVSFEDHFERTMLSVAIFNRQEKIFNLVYQVCDPMIRDQLINKRRFGKTNLHLAAMLNPSSYVPGAALQMQRELQWFKTIEDRLHPSLQIMRDTDGKTAKDLFTETHRELVDKGEKWMKDTATSCSVVAALIITVVFAAAFTVPGGIDSKGRPIFSQELSFKIFAISNALALFSSTASVQMFLGILASRYAEEDFLISLPKKLIIGLITLFFSIASMMVAFAATFYIVIAHPYRWVTFPIASLGAVPVTLFAGLQFPLLVDIFKSTYEPGISKPVKVEYGYI